MSDLNNDYYSNSRSTNPVSTGYGSNTSSNTSALWNKRISTAGSTGWDTNGSLRYGQQQYSRSRDDFVDTQRRGEAGGSAGSEHFQHQPYSFQQRPQQQPYGFLDVHEALNKIRDEMQQLQHGPLSRSVPLEQFDEANKTIERRLAAVENRQRDVVHEINNRLERVEKVVEEMVQEIRKAALASNAAISAQIQHGQQPVTSTMYGISPDVALRARQSQPFMHPAPYGAPGPFAATLHHNMGPLPQSRGPPRHDLSSNWPDVHGRLGGSMRPHSAAGLNFGRDSMHNNGRQYRNMRQNMGNGNVGGKTGGKGAGIKQTSNAAGGRSKQQVSGNSSNTSKEKSEASTNGQGSTNKRARTSRGGKGHRDRRQQLKLQRQKDAPSAAPAAAADTNVTFTITQQPDSAATQENTTETMETTANVSEPQSSQPESSLQAAKVPDMPVEAAVTSEQN